MLIALALQSNPLSSILKLVIILLVVSFVLYLYFGFALMLLARKTETPGAGLAWLPIGNLFLMCKIARRPGWWTLLLLIPVLNLFFIALIWMSIAEVCGRPAWIGGLAAVPVLGLIAPLYLALLGRSTAPGLTVVSRACKSCGLPIVGAENFCRHCGQTAPTIALGRRTPLGKMALMSAGWTLFSVILIGGFGWFLFFRGLAYTPPERRPPEMPPRLAGTMTEFPVDTNSSTPLVPDDVVAQSEASGGLPPKEQVPQERLPPGLTRDTLSKRTSSLTSVTYKKRKPKKEDETPAIETATGEQVYVCVLRVLPEATNTGQELADLIASATSGARSTIRVQSPNGGVYVGSKIKTAQISVYVLEKQGADVLTLVYAPTPEAEDEAARLAGNVGNGEGLNDYPEFRESVWVLPQAAPGGLVLQEITTRSRAEMGAGEIESARTDDPDAQRWLEYIKQLIPERAISGRYRDASRREWEVVVYDYASTRKAWNTWFFVSWT
ncbi:MAG: hypothetical protein H7Y30_06910, partial [Pyrinomonadaceae bacterium]|nr:hypothetical protein [Pyrinomonadaceae bacterium]